MARAGELSVVGLYEWDNSLFDLLVIPSDIDRDTLIENILAETIELEVLYPNPTVLKNLIGVWSRKESPIWEKLYNTTQYEYNPIENYNRYEDGSAEGSSTRTNTDTRGHWVAGFDAPTPSGNNDGLVKQTRDQDDGTVSAENSTEHQLHAHGNIGVTTTQKLIREQREIERFNIYDIIIEDFKKRFCILIY